MQKERITDKEAILLLAIFIMGSSLIIGIGGDSKNDKWISGLIGIAMAIPILLIYSRILSLFEGKDLFDILNITFGKVVGKVISVFYIWYAFHLGALVLRNFGEFSNTVAMPETPMIIPMLGLGIVCIIAARLGIEVISRMATFFFPIIIFILVVVQLLAIPQLEFNNLKPVFGNSLATIIGGAFSSFSFPFAETVLFICIFGALKNKKSPRKVYLLGLVISGIIIVLLTIRNIAVLGNVLGDFYFPAYEAVSRINIGDFLQRIEVTVSLVFFFGVFLKTSVCLLVACKGIGKVFGVNNYTSVVIQTGLLMVYFAFIVYDNIMEMRYWAFKVYEYYAFPFQVILPIIIWIFAEIKARKKKQVIA